MNSLIEEENHSPHISVMFWCPCFTWTCTHEFWYNLLWSGYTSNILGPKKWYLAKRWFTTIILPGHWKMVQSNDRSLCLSVSRIIPPRTDPILLSCFPGIDSHHYIFLREYWRIFVRGSHTNNYLETTRLTQRMWISFSFLELLRSTQNTS